MLVYEMCIMMSLKKSTAGIDLSLVIFEMSVWRLKAVLD